MPRRNRSAPDDRSQNAWTRTGPTPDDRATPNTHGSYSSRRPKSQNSYSSLLGRLFRRFRSSSRSSPRYASDQTTIFGSEDSGDPWRDGIDKWRDSVHPTDGEGPDTTGTYTMVLYMRDIPPDEREAVLKRIAGQNSGATILVHDELSGPEDTAKDRRSGRRGAGLRSSKRSSNRRRKGGRRSPGGNCGGRSNLNSDRTSTRRESRRGGKAVGELVSSSRQPETRPGDQTYPSTTQIQSTAQPTQSYQPGYHPQHPQQHPSYPQTTDTAYSQAYAPADQYTAAQPTGTASSTLPPTLVTAPSIPAPTSLPSQVSQIRTTPAPLHPTTSTLPTSTLSPAVPSALSPSPVPITPSPAKPTSETPPQTSALSSAAFDAFYSDPANRQAILQQIKRDQPAQSTPIAASAQTLTSSSTAPPLLAQPLATVSVN